MFNAFVYHYCIILIHLLPLAKCKTSSKWGYLSSGLHPPHDAEIDNAPGQQEAQCLALVNPSILSDRAADVQGLPVEKVLRGRGYHTLFQVPCVVAIYRTL